MKVVVAIDSLKGSLSSMEAGLAVQEGILKVDENIEVIVKPLADGGEGTTEALIQGMGGEEIVIPVRGPLGTTVMATYGYVAETKTAMIEMATAAGIVLVGEDKRPKESTTYGVGELILDGMQRGCRNFIIGIGGSATNDGGMGMLMALGYEFLDQNDNAVGMGAGSLGKVRKITGKNRVKVLDECTFKVACDVNNPLCGVNGATYIYGPQKGVQESEREEIDKDMAWYADRVVDFVGADCKDIAGAGAAGGLGFAFLSFLNTKLQSGISLVMEVVELENSLENADFVITGEGRLDHQTAMGKAPIGVAKLAKKYGATTIAFAGSIAETASDCNAEGIDAYFPILQQVTSLEEAMNREVSRNNIMRTAEQVFRLIKCERE